MYNVALVSGVQQSEPNTNTYIHFFRFFFHIGHYSVLFPVLYCSLVLISYLFFYTVMCICQSQSPNLSFPRSPLVTIPTSVTLLLFCK